MLRKILVLAAVGFMAMCLSIAVAYFLWHTPAESVEGKHATAADESKHHEPVEAPKHGTPEVKASEPMSPEHGESPSHSAPLESPAPSGGAANPIATIRSGPAFEVAQAALSSLLPQDGLKQVEAALALPHNPEQGALLREAEGELYAQLSPPDYAKSQAAFEQALELSADTILEEEIRYKAVQMLMQAGKDGEALQLAAAQFVVSPPTGAAGFKLKLLLGQLHERAGNIEQAEKNYRAVLEAAGSLSKDLGRAEAASLARLSALRLTQCYRSHGREEEIEGVTSWLKKLLGQIQEGSN